MEENIGGRYVIDRITGMTLNYNNVLFEDTGNEAFTVTDDNAEIVVRMGANTTPWSIITHSCSEIELFNENDAFHNIITLKDDVPFAITLKDNKLCIEFKGENSREVINKLMDVITK